jgi:hypothetical protein
LFPSEDDEGSRNGEAGAYSEIALVGGAISVRSLQTRERKVIQAEWSSEKRQYVYDLVADPAETEALSGPDAEDLEQIGESLEARVQQIRGGSAPGQTTGVDSNTRRKLESLGYL